ncbi:MAG: hypothetical protein QXS20_09505 [Candidatus Thorarchaeota archaeon]
MGRRILKQVKCPKCGSIIDGVVVDEDSVLQATRVPVFVTAKCKSGDAVLLMVDRAFLIRDVEVLGTVPQDEDKKSVDRAIEWMESF